MGPTNEERAYEAEFEALGEVEVNDRLERGRYEGAARAYALRWLNDRAMARLTGASFLAAPVAAELAALARRSRSNARWAVIWAAVAGIITASNIAYAAYASFETHQEQARARAAIAAAVRRHAPDQARAQDDGNQLDPNPAVITIPADQPPPVVHVGGDDSAASHKDLH